VPVTSVFNRGIFAPQRHKRAVKAVAGGPELSYGFPDLSLFVAPVRRDLVGN